MADLKKNIKIPIYEGILAVVFTDDHNIYEASKRHFGLNQDSLKNCNAAVLQRNNYLPRIYPIVFSCNYTPGIIAHEANHFINYLFSDLGVKRDMHNDEAESYFMAWVVDRIWSIQNEYVKIKSKENAKESKTSTDGLQAESAEPGGNTYISTEGDSATISKEGGQSGVSRYQNKKTNTV